MKRVNYKKIIFNFVLIVFVSFLALSNYVYADLGGPLDDSILEDVTSDVNTSSDVMKPIMKVYGTIFTVLKILGVAGVAYMGVKYMFAGAEDKGMIKKTLIWVAIGVIFIFSAEGIIKFVIKMGNEVLETP